MFYYVPQTELPAVIKTAIEVETHFLLAFVTEAESCSAMFSSCLTLRASAFQFLYKLNVAEKFYTSVFLQ